MIDKHKEKVLEISGALYKNFHSIIARILENEGEMDTSDVINICLSAHVSSAFTIMNDLTEDNEPMNKKVKEFILEFEQFSYNFFTKELH